jgi:hypothetical protein
MTVSSSSVGCSARPRRSKSTHSSSAQHGAKCVDGLVVEKREGKRRERQRYSRLTTTTFDYQRSPRRATPEPSEPRAQKKLHPRCSQREELLGLKYESHQTMHLRHPSCISTTHIRLFTTKEYHLTPLQSELVPARCFLCQIKS